MENAIENNEIIPESKAARWAWRVSLIPLLGVPLYAVLAFIALYRIGNKGRTGFWLLRRGVVAVLLLSVVPYFGLYLSGYSGYAPIVYQSLYEPLRFPKHGVYCVDVIVDDWADPRTEMQYWRFGTKDGKWTDWWDDKLEQEYAYSNGQLEGEWVRWFGNYVYERTTYKNGKMNGPYIVYMDANNCRCKGSYINNIKTGIWTYYRYGNTIESTELYDAYGNLTKEDTYDDDGKIISIKEYPVPTPSPQPSPSPAPEGKSK